MGYLLPVVNASVKSALSRDQVSNAKPGPLQRPPDPYDPNCPTRLMLDRIGDKWTVLVLGLLREEPLRFNQMRRAIGGVTQKMLSQTLKGLERDGLVTRQVLPTSPITVEYSLTRLGSTLTSTIDELQRWAQDHMEDVAKAQRRYDDSQRASAARRPASPGARRVQMVSKGEPSARRVSPIAAALRDL